MLTKATGMTQDLNPYEKFAIKQKIDKLCSELVKFLQALEVR